MLLLFQQSLANEHCVTDRELLRRTEQGDI